MIVAIISISESGRDPSLVKLRIQDSIGKLARGGRMVYVFVSKRCVEKEMGEGAGSEKEIEERLRARDV